tara:strand:- start:410 stop:655 length:246 start_codon:yes stop_codon:yes gene_type:complete
MVWIKLFLSFLVILTSVNASELTQEEINYFRIVDLNNDDFVSIDEINQSTGIIFQLIDINKDNKISLSELEELKEIIEMLK